MGSWAGVSAEPVLKSAHDVTLSVGQPERS